MASALSCVSIRTVEERTSPSSPPTKVNAYVEERMSNIRGIITPLQGYNPEEKKWQTSHFIAHPTIGKELMILTEDKQNHAKIHKDTHTFFSTIFKSEQFQKSLRANLKAYLEKYQDNDKSISLKELVSELITVVVQNTINGYSHEIHEPAYWVDKCLGIKNDQLQSVEEIDKAIAAPPAWYERPLAKVMDVAKPLLMTFAFDRHVEKIYKEGIQGRETYPKYLQDQGHTEEAVKANIKTSFFAQETMRNLLLFMLYEYAKDEQMQKIDRDTVVQNSKQEASAALPEAIEKRVLVALHEYPTGGTTRIADEPTLISWEEQGVKHEYFIPAGDLIVYSPYAASHWPVVREEVFKDPKGEFAAFDMQKLRQLSHLPFGSGPHKCPAQRFVVPVMGVILSEILSTCQIKLEDSHHVLKLAISTTLQPDSDIKVLFRDLYKPMVALSIVYDPEDIAVAFVEIKE